MQNEINNKLNLLEREIELLEEQNKILTRNTFFTGASAVLAVVAVIIALIALFE